MTFWTRQLCFGAAALAIGYGGAAQAGSFDIEALFDSGGAGYDRFGDAVAIDGNWLAVGAPWDDLDSDAGTTDTDKNGTVHMFQRQGGDWVFKQELQHTTDFGGDFGADIDIDTHNGVTRMVVSSGGDNGGSGSAQIYKLNGSTWQHEQELTISNSQRPSPSLNKLFAGGDVVIDGNRIIVGYLNSPYVGAAYVFEYDSIGQAWSYDRKLQPNTAPPGCTALNGCSEFLGEVIALQGDLALIAARNWEDSSGNTDGRVYAYNLAGNFVDRSTDLVELADGIPDTGFGWSLGLSDTYKGMIGAPVNGNGVVTLWDFATWDDPRTWSSQTLTAPFGDTSDGFGSAIAMDGDRALIAHGDAGNVYLYDLNDLAADPEVLALAQAGISKPVTGFGVGYYDRGLAITADHIAIGVLDDDDNGPQSGSVAMFSTGNGVPTVPTPAGAALLLAGLGALVTRRR